jgi:hypothetical protein
MPTVRQRTGNGEFYPPVGQQQTGQIMHKNAGNPVAPDHTFTLNSYPDRRVRSFVVPSDRPQWTTLYVDGRQRILTVYQTPKGKVFVSPSSSVPQGQEQFLLARRMYIYNGQVVTE